MFQFSLIINDELISWPFFALLVYMVTGIDIIISPDSFLLPRRSFGWVLVFALAQRAYDAIPVATESGKWIFCTLQFGETNGPFSVTEKYPEGQYLLSMAHTQEPC